MILREATINDLPLLRYWDQQAHVIAADPNDDWNWEEELQRKPEWREQWIAESDGRPIGFVEIIDPAREDIRYWGDTPPDLRAIDIWIGDEEDTGKGYGTQMMQLAIQRCFENEKVTAILLDPLASNVKARKFYERLGFRLVEYRQFNEDYCAVYELNRNEWKAVVSVV